MSDEPTRGRAPDPEEEIFEACLARPIEERAGYLDRVCAGDAALRRRVEELLRSHSLAESFLEGPKPAADVVKTIKLVIANLPSENDVGKTVGRYKLLQQIGEGGCGTVYMAEQQEPVRRRVALKVIKLGMDTKSVIARFEAERQALAMMDHPNIAKVLDAGRDGYRPPLFRDGIGARHQDHRILRPEQPVHPGAPRSCSSKSAMPCSMRIKKASFIGTSNRPTSWSR